MAAVELDPPPEIAEPDPTFTIAHQTLDLEVDFSEQIRGRTEITIYPDSPQLRIIKLNSRQCSIDKVRINGLKPAALSYQDPCHRLTLHGRGSVHQHHILLQKIESSISGEPEGELVITIPENLKIEEVNLAEIHTQTAGTIKIGKSDTAAVDIVESTQALADTSVAKYTPLTISIEFQSLHLRDGLHFVVGKSGNGLWPHVYTRGKVGYGAAPCVFPCVDSVTARCTWDISIRCARTMNEALRQALSLNELTLNETTPLTPSGREMIVVCSGDVTDDIVDKNDPTKKTVSFSCSQQLSAQQIGFAIGPFERVNLSSLREVQDEEELGQNAVEMIAYCLPGRKDEVRNTCLPTIQAIDFIVRKYVVACPFRTYSMCFVEESSSSTSVYAGLTLCSTRMLYPEDVIDPAQAVTRELVQAISSQWVGINIVAEDPRDTWTIAGISHFITDTFMKELCGNNEYRFHMKKQSDLICKLDHNRPSIYEMGALQHVDPSEAQFINLKAPVVLFILDRRIAKVAGASKMPGIISKILGRARLGDLANNLLSTEIFQKICERFYHAKIDDFLNQWVKGAGCPRFQVLQRFNKKKLVVEMVIQQVQGNMPSDRDLEIDTFMRDVREDFEPVYAAPLQSFFTGSMTIRIHEADGTPYEHIVELKDMRTTFDIPYNTKYKRLKRSKRQKSKATTETADGENDSLVYCLGDVLQTEDEVLNWRLTDWSAEDEERMSAESYEWIRIDADFEWICRIQLQMPGYMSVSQLQQDRDVVAQCESIHHINNYPASPLISSILLRTMMDKRYFHGIRSLAARSLVKHAKNEGEADNIGLFHLKKAFEELYCITDQGTSMTRPNDFSDTLSYFLQEEIVSAISQVRDVQGHTPREVKEFLLDKLRFNDNSANRFSDAFYISRLMTALCSAVTARPPRNRAPREIELDTMQLDEMEEENTLHRLEDDCVAEIDRYRRMDEWTSSYQNLYSRTALECQWRLTEAKITSYSPLHFLQYTRPGNYDMLRLAAYQTLIQADIFSNTTILKYILHCLVADSSPWIRESLQTAFGKALAALAIGGKKEDLKPVNELDELVVEDPAVTEARQKAVSRRKTLEGAVTALSEELGQDEGVKVLIWDAICHPEIGLDDLKALLDICRLLYKPLDKLWVTLKYPKYWKVENLGKGKLRFYQTDKVRTKIMPKWKPPSLPVVPKADSRGSSAKPQGKLKLSFGNPKKLSSPALTPGPTPTPPLPVQVSAPTETTEPPPVRRTLTLKFGIKKEEN